MPTLAHRSMPTRAPLRHTSGRKTALPGSASVFGAKCAPAKRAFTHINHKKNVASGLENHTRSTCHGTYVDEAICYVNGSTKYYPHANHLYSVAALTDAAGAVTERYRYDAYGKRTVLNAAGAVIPKSTVGFQRGFTGYHLDAESGLYFARARMYSPGLGRFISRDPHMYLQGAPTAIDGYLDGYSLYCGYFAMLGKVDPTGMGIIQDIQYLLDLAIQQLGEQLQKCCNAVGGRLGCQACILASGTAANVAISAAGLAAAGSCPSTGFGMFACLAATAAATTDALSTMFDEIVKAAECCPCK